MVQRRVRVSYRGDTGEVIDSADEFKEWWDAPRSIERVYALRGPVAESVLQEVVTRFPECRFDVARRRDLSLDVLAVLQQDEDEATRRRVRFRGLGLEEHPEDAGPWLDDPEVPVHLRLTDDERELLRAGLEQWGCGPTMCTEELAVAMGFQSLADLYEQAERIADGIGAGEPQTSTDWTRALLATEVVFSSDVVGSGVDWTLITGIPDHTALDLLRGLQERVPTSNVLGTVFGTRPPSTVRNLDDQALSLSLELSRSDAVVLTDWLTSVDLDAVPVTHPGEKQALADLLLKLKHARDMPRGTEESLDPNGR